MPPFLPCHPWAPSGVLLSLDRAIIFAQVHAHLSKYAASHTGCLAAVVAAKAPRCLARGDSAPLQRVEE